MNNLDRMKLIKLGVKDLEESVCAYEYARKKNPNIQDAVTGKHWAHVVMPEPPKEDA